jgi:DNA-binding SARP family transcriptional activator
VEVGILGPLEVRDDSGQVVSVPGGRQRALLALLALNAGKVTSAERLIDDLWGSLAPRRPANALQVGVSKLRGVVGAERIETRPPGYVLAVADDEVDAIRFEHLVAEGRAAVAGGRSMQAIECFERALREWRGAPLAEFGDLPTALAAASRWEELRSSAAEDRFDALLAMGRGAELIADLDAAIVAAPFRERLRGQLMLALYRSGRQADALRAFRDARHVLAEELGLEPGTELRRLEAAILDQDPSLDPPVESRVAAGVTRTAATNLRPALTSFIGREQDLAGIDELLADHRMVTLVGAGGCGKTRLATQVAANATAAYTDGVWLVPFDSLTSGDGVPAATATALGLSTADTAGQPASSATGSLDRVRELLSGRTALIVLDNCEHVIDDAAALAEELLASAPRLRLLATSREALRVPGEMVWSVPPLDIEDSIALFVDRARAATTSFELGDDEGNLAADLCARLDGMPLAIELTAARTSAFTLSQLAERLDDRFRLLTGGARSALPRQQTLRAVTDGSYDQLI